MFTNFKNKKAAEASEKLFESACAKLSYECARRNTPANYLGYSVYGVKAYPKYIL